METQKDKIIAERFAAKYTRKELRSTSKQYYLIYCPYCKTDFETDLKYDRVPYGIQKDGAGGIETGYTVEGYYCKHCSKPVERPRELKRSRVETEEWYHYHYDANRYYNKNDLRNRHDGPC